MAYKNYYNMKNASGTSLTDSVGGNTGTLGGSDLPDINSNGYLEFTSAHNATPGNWQRVNVATESDFRYSNTSAFSYAILFRSSKTDGLLHSLISTGNWEDAGKIYMYLDPSEQLSIFFQCGSKSKVYIGSSSICDGKWHLVVAVYSSDTLAVYVDGGPVTLTQNQAYGSANFYPASNCKTVLGALWSRVNANYVYDGISDIAYFINYNHALSAAEAKNLYIHLKELVGF